MELQEVELLAKSCELCELCKGRIKPVFARGYEKSNILICGMCPGRDENLEGYPFVRAAGKLLDNILYDVFPNVKDINEYVYITNLVKCFVKPGTKLKEEWMNSCLSYFLVQLFLIKPKVIIGLGKDVCNYLLNIEESIGKMREYNSYYMNSKLICTYHPSYLVRGGGVNHKDYDKVVNDFKKALNI